MTEKMQRIKNIIECCQSVGENDIAKIVAYDHIKRIMGESLNHCDSEIEAEYPLGRNDYQE